MKKLAKLFPMFAPGLVALFFTVVGGVIGAFYQEYFDTRLEEEKALLEFRKEAYTEFFKGQTALQTLRRRGDSLSEAERNALDSEYRKSVTNARPFIAIFSSKPVVDAMANLFRSSYNYETCGGPRQIWLEEANLYQKMRQELFGSSSSQHVDDKNLVLLILNCQLPD